MTRWATCGLPKPADAELGCRLKDGQPALARCARRRAPLGQVPGGGARDKVGRTVKRSSRRHAQKAAPACKPRGIAAVRKGRVRLGGTLVYEGAAHMGDSLRRGQTSIADRAGGCSAGLPSPAASPIGTPSSFAV